MPSINIHVVGFSYTDIDEFTSIVVTAMVVVTYIEERGTNSGVAAIKDKMEQYLQRRCQIVAIGEKALAFLAGTVFLTMLPYIHLGLYYNAIWGPGKPRVQRTNCTCTCFDTLFKGPYEKPGGVGYKHIYFNTTWQTHRMWIVTVVCVLMAYESIKYLIPLIRKGNARISMFLLCLSNVYPLYYSWWAYLNYYNDDFYEQFTHQTWFSITELISTCIVLNLCDKRNEITSSKILTIVSVGVGHIMTACLDQFISNTILRRGYTYQMARDIGFMIPDCLHVAIPLWELYTFAKKRDVKMNQLYNKLGISMSIIFIFMGTLFVKSL